MLCFLIPQSHQAHIVDLNYSYINRILCNISTCRYMASIHIALIIAHDRMKMNIHSTISVFTYKPLPRYQNGRLIGYKIPITAEWIVYRIFWFVVILKMH